MMLKHCFISFLINFFWIYGGGSLPVQESLGPLSIEFQSFNLQSILHWHPGSASTPNNTVYFVQYKIYGQKKWTNKEECWGIYELSCDLTNETSDVQEPYYGRVKAASAGIHGDWSITKRFIPWWETKIGPVSISVIQNNKSIQLTLHAPDSPYKGKKGRNISIQDYYELVYRVFITNNSLDMKQKVYEGTNDKVEVDVMPGSNNCVVAEIYLPELDRSSMSTEICSFMAPEK
ncbi:interleukin-22 receptor subunit alpha-2 isoform X2 [Phascolarctos cinereus]|uniref:Interleukin-22 receptor subunit alpha-2 n=1 Tax=Phascolarctos cinereus TaxID=38626 RepID=A0A6P5KBG7_PHACI|nr:interleukin-22 receptor subunit alpha-2 isoform X2 [Phascolarctos cinereus]